MRIYAFADEASPMIDGQIEAMKRNGLCGLEIRNVDQVNVAKITLEKAREVKAKMDTNGLAVWSIGSPIGKLKPEGDFEEHLDEFKHTLEIADILKAENIRLFSFYLPKESNFDEYKDYALERMSRFVEIAKRSNVTLCHENEKGIYGDIARRCVEIHMALPEIKAVFDPANFVQCGQDTLEAWELLKPYVKYMHIKDALPDGNVVPAGKGAGNVPQLLKNYRDIGGECLTLEPHLAVFDGLKALENEDDASVVGQFVYPSNDAAFDAACEALKSIL